MTERQRSTVLFFGGAGDRRSSIVYGYHRACRLDALCDRRYYEHHQGRLALRHARYALESSQALILIGHSWGADTAAQVALKLNARVNLLVGVDPVAKPLSRMMARTGRSAETKRVVTVDGGPVRRSRGDQIKAIGTRLGGGMPVVFDQPDRRIVVDHRHDDFELMFNAKGDDGLSAADFVSAVESGRVMGGAMG
jgi:pimeloyl-ACP methyl ester carboxylesterase